MHMKQRVSKKKKRGVKNSCAGHRIEKQKASGFKSKPELKENRQNL